MEVNSGYYKEQLKEHFSFRMEKNARYSLRAYAKSLRVDVSDLSKVFSDKKALSIPSAEKVTSQLELDPDERDLFMLSVFSDHQERGRKHKYPDLIVKDLKRDEKSVDLDSFRVMSDWHHFAILEMTHTEDFPNDMLAASRRISQRLGLGQTDARLALERLMKLELLESKAGFLKKTGRQLEMPSKKSMAATRKFIKQSLVKCEDSLENCPSELRKNKVITLAINPDKLDKAKELIDEFQNKMTDFLEKGTREKVYQFSIGLFPVEKSRAIDTDG